MQARCETGCVRGRAGLIHCAQGIEGQVRFGIVLVLVLEIHLKTTTRTMKMRIYDCFSHPATSAAA